MKKIIITIIALVLLISSLLIDKFVFSQEEIVNPDIVIYVEIIKGNEKVEQELFVESDSTFLIEINKHFEVEINNGFLYKIDFLEAYDNNVAYISILVNGTYSNYGISNLKLNDQDKVSFIYVVL